MLVGKLAAGVLAVGALVIAAMPSWAENEQNTPAALAKVLPQASVTLDQGLKAGQREGQSISGKYEIEDGALQLSVYTGNEGQFSEVIVDHTSGTIKKVEKITDGDDLKQAKEQSAAMANAKLPLEQVVAKAVKSNDGYRAVSATPMISAGTPVVSITLMKGTDVKKVVEKLE